MIIQPTRAKVTAANVSVTATYGSAVIVLQAAP